MTSTQLRRVDALPGDLSTLAERAANELGYTKLRGQNMSATLANCLQQAGIRPYNADDIKAYKESVLKKVNRIPSVIWWPVTILCCLLIATPIVAAVLSGMWLLLLATIISLFISGIIISETTDALTRHGWVATPLAEYREQVPTYAVETALAVHKELENAGIEHRLLVEHLGSVSPDPFLVLEAQNSWVYLEAWDEPDFFKERTV